MLRDLGLKVAFPQRTFATVDHIVPTDQRVEPFKDTLADAMIKELRKNCTEFGVTFFDIPSGKQGIVHIVGPEQGITQPGTTIACGDSCLPGGEVPPRRCIRGKNRPSRNFSTPPFVRRYTGGGLVEHGRDLTYTLVLPSDHSLTLAGTLPSYRAIPQGLAFALQSVGLECRLATAQPEKDHASCFLKQVPADVLDPKGNKLAGAAQRRTKQGCLHQGSILLPGPLPSRLAEILAEKLAPALGVKWTASQKTTAEEDLAETLLRDRYSTPGKSQNQPM